MSQAAGELPPAPGTDAQDVNEETDTVPSGDPEPDTTSTSAKPFEDDDPEAV